MKFLVGLILVVCIFSAGLALPAENPSEKTNVTSLDPVSQTDLPPTEQPVKPDDDDHTTPVPDIPITTSDKNDTTTTTETTSTTSSTTTEKPTTTTTPITTSTTITPNTTTLAPNSTTTTTTTTEVPTTPVPVPTTTMKPEPPRTQWSTTSFIGGMVFAFGMMAIGFVSFKFYKARNERNYHTL